MAAARSAAAAWGTAPWCLLQRSRRSQGRAAARYRALGAQFGGGDETHRGNVVQLRGLRRDQAEAIVDLALEDDGGAVTAAEASARVAALTPLARAARHALVAAGSPEVWPPS